MAELVEGDAQLLTAWQAGDQAAGERLFDCHADAVARFFETKVRNGAEDLVQSTFLRMLEGRERIRQGRAFRPFMLGVARNVLREHLRELARGKQIDPEVDCMAALDPGPSTVMGRRQEHQLMLEGLRHLPIEEQIVLELFYWEGLRAHEIGEIVGLSASAIRRRLAEARAHLDETMAQLSASAELLSRALRNFDSWVAELDQQLGYRRKLAKNRVLRRDRKK